MTHIDWRSLSEPLLAFLRSLPGGADWPWLTAWRKESVVKAGRRGPRMTSDEVGNCLAWLEAEGLARSTGGREIVAGAQTAFGKDRVRDLRVGDPEPVRWHAVVPARTPAAAPGGPQGAPCPVVPGPAPPAVLPPLRGPFLAGRPPAPPPSPPRDGVRGSRDPRTRPDGPVRLTSEDRALRAEACAPRIARLPRRMIALGTGEPRLSPNDIFRPQSREVRLLKQREAGAARRERGRVARAAAPLPPDVPRPGLSASAAKKRDEARARRKAWLDSKPACAGCGAVFTKVAATAPLPERCAACRRKRRVATPPEHPACCGCAECEARYAGTAA